MRINLGLAGALAAFVLSPLAAWGQTVRFSTSLGDIDVQLLPDSAPKTVANFMNYVNRGAYNSSIFHRSAPGFVIQGGGFTWTASLPSAIAADAPVVNEYNVSNTRGTLAMAKTAAGPNTATNQWFFNLADNSSNLNNQNGGFTVFGKVNSAAGLAVMDKIAAQTVYTLFVSPFDALPVINYSSGTPTSSNGIFVNSITVVDDAGVADGGVVTASAFGAFPYAAPGSFIEIYGSKLGPDAARGWATTDFNNGVAPLNLDGVTVTIKGILCYVNYVSANQINVQVPASVPPGSTVPVVVTYNKFASPASQLAIKALAPGLLAPASFKEGDKQFVAAFRSDGTLVNAGAPALPGETLIFYGTGFGPVSPSSVAIAGRIASGQSSITAPIVFTFGSSKGSVLYKGLAPGYVGLYQFNVTLPFDIPANDIPMTVTLNNDPLPQTLYLK
jgi:uncharacterized protein (TIGR03437 family)